MARKKLRKEKNLDFLEQMDAVVDYQMSMKQVKPLTEKQSQLFDSFYSGKDLMLHGSAGTGKTFLSMYLALTDIIERKKYSKLTLVRSIVPTREIGFLPGSLEEKIEIYELPYVSICAELFGRKDAYYLLKSYDMIDFICTSYIRGVTLNNTVIIVDECENLNYHELDSIITRVGDNCKIIFSGDTKQSDFTRLNEKIGFINFKKIIDNLDFFDTIEFSKNDIVRSRFVKNYLIAKEIFEDSLT